MNEPKLPSPEDAPGHYGAGYGEQVPPGVRPRPAPKTDADTPAPDDVTPNSSAGGASPVDERTGGDHGG